MLNRSFVLWRFISAVFLAIAFASAVSAQNLSPTMEQDYMDAKAAMEDAKKVKADKYAPDKIREAAEWLKKAEQARSSKENVQFSRASHLARALSESAKAATELEIAKEKLAATNADVIKIKAEIQRLNKAK